MQAELAHTVDEPMYRIWLAPLRARSLSDERLLLEAPAHALIWTRDRFGGVLRDCAQIILGPDVLVELVAAGEEAANRAGPASAAPAADYAPSEPLCTPDLESLPGPLANPKLTFEQFVIGDCNRLAHAAALTVAEMPAHAYNPLFICGPPGVGKTHLLSSIARLLLTHNPGLTVRCTTGETFTNEFLDALGGGRTDSFKARFRHVDMLLLDDVQFLERKARTEEEFFHTFNALHDAGRQIVLTSDRAPQSLKALEDRLRERFAAGLVADIEPPDPGTRLTILRKRVQHDHIDLVDHGALELIAERVTTNVRALEGALIRIVAFGSLTGRPLTAELAREVLERLYPPSSALGGAGSIANIQACACKHFEISRDELLSSSRSPRIAWPRQVAMYLARELTSESLPAIGRQFGGRDHTTVLHAWRRTAARIADDDATRVVVDEIRRNLSTSSPDRRA